MKCVPWLLIKNLGHLNRVITCSNNKWVAISALQSFTSVASTHVVRYFITVMMYLSPVIFVGELIGPTKSIAHLLNASSVTYGCNGISSLLLGLPTL
jgi:hypothetical protein